MDLRTRPIIFHIFRLLLDEIQLCLQKDLSRVVAGFAIYFA